MTIRRSFCSRPSPAHASTSRYRSLTPTATTSSVRSSAKKGTVNLPDPYAVVKRANASRSFPILTDWKDRFIEAYDIELTHWVKTLEEKGEPDGLSAWDGYAACVAADALNRSRGTGRFLPVETMEKPELYR